MVVLIVKNKGKRTPSVDVKRICGTFVRHTGDVYTYGDEVRRSIEKHCPGLEILAVCPTYGLVLSYRVSLRSRNSLISAASQLSERVRERLEQDLESKYGWSNWPFGDNPDRTAGTRPVVVCLGPTSRIIINVVDLIVTFEILRRSGLCYVEEPIWGTPR